MIKSLMVQMKSKEEIESTFIDVDEWGDTVECTIKPYKERIEMCDYMLDVIGGKEIEVFPYRDHGSYTMRYWYEDKENMGSGVAMYLLKEWVE